MRGQPAESLPLVTPSAAGSRRPRGLSGPFPSGRARPSTTLDSLGLTAAGSFLETMDDYEVVAQELSELGEKLRDLEERLAEVERVNARLEEAALTTARALGEVSRHWDAVYDAMRRADQIDKEISSERDHDAAKARRS